jgi:hypothetical protein
MLKGLLCVALLLGSVAHSYASAAGVDKLEQSSPREGERKAEAAQNSNQGSEGSQSRPPPAPASAPAPIINIYTKKHSDEPSHCAESKDWKEWGSFAWCRSLEWIDAERVIAIWTVVLGIATCILGIATVRLWRATDRLVEGAEKTAERQLRAYITAKEAAVVREGDTNFRIYLKFLNTGQTPAYNFSCWHKSDVRASSWRPPFLDTSNIVGVSIIGADAPSYATTDFVISEQDRRAIEGEGLCVFVWGRIDYHDAFERPRFLYFRMGAAGKLRSVQFDSIKGQGWALVPLGYYTDEYEQPAPNEADREIQTRA